ncbi:MAG: peptidoglycan bridge formation glycyltransferase FemA/FemB family protein [Parcubacteria group bacterium]
MDVRKIEDQKTLDGFVASQPRSQFLQSWAWGVSKEQEGFPVRRFGLYDGEQLIGAATFIEVSLPTNKKYWYSPRGPVFPFSLRQDILHTAVDNFLTALTDQVREAGAMFLRIEPALERGDLDRFGEIENKLGVVSSKAIQPPDTLIIDISSSEGELLGAMHEKTRYNIRLAERKGVRVRIGDVEDLPKFHALNVETTARDDFHSHEPAYYDHLFKALPSDFLMLYLAEYEGSVIAANIVVTYGDMTTYLHGASSDHSRNVMAPHLLQWRQIQDAKKRQHGWYDFWGVAPPHTGVSHPWAGITRFKKGFGDSDVRYLGTLDIPLKKWWYTMYTTVRRK